MKKDDGLETGALTDEAIRRVINAFKYQDARPVPFVDLSNQKQLTGAKKHCNGAGCDNGDRCWCNCKPCGGDGRPFMPPEGDHGREKTRTR